MKFEQTRRCWSASGLSMLDAVFTMALMGICGSVTIVSFGAGVEQMRGETAARHLLALFADARTEAARRGGAVGVCFDPIHRDVTYRMHVDGNGNGIRRADVLAGADPPLGAPDALTDRFAGVRIALDQGVPGIDGDPPIAAGSDPVRFGATDVASFSPSGTSSSGTVYLHGRDGVVWAVRLYGATGRARILRLDPATRNWEAR